MTPELKAKLAEHKRRKREQTRLLKDVPGFVLAAHAWDEYDPVQAWPDLCASTFLPRHPKDIYSQGAFLNYASPDQIAWLKRYVPHVIESVASRIGVRVVPVFPADRLLWAR